MKVFLDECVKRRITPFIVGHEIKTARQMGWTSIKNGALLALCAAQFDVFLKVDKNLRHQQNLAGLDMAIVVMAAPTNQLRDLLPLVPNLLAALATCSKGAATLVEGTP